MTLNARESQAPAEAEQGSTNEITPTLVQQIADRVYKLLLQEVRIDFERGRPSIWRTPNNRGGR
jgi:hypothetical protein